MSFLLSNELSFLILPATPLFFQNINIYINMNMTLAEETFILELAFSSFFPTSTFCNFLRFFFKLESLLLYRELNFNIKITKKKKSCIAFSIAARGQSELWYKTTAKFSFFFSKKISEFEALNCRKLVDCSLSVGVLMGLLGPLR